MAPTLTVLWEIRLETLAAQIYQGILLSAGPGINDVPVLHGAVSERQSLTLKVIPQSPLNLIDRAV